MNRAEIAIDKFNSGYNCAQSVLFAFAGNEDVSFDLALKIANGFGGGMGRTQDVCGAVSGGIMVLGLHYGRGEFDGIEKQERIYHLTREFLESFKKRFGTIQCKDLLPECNLLTEEGQAMFKDKELKQICRNCVAHVVNSIEALSEKKNAGVAQ